MTDPVDVKVAPWLEHRHELLRIRHAVFVREQGVPEAMEEDQHDPGAQHLLAYTARGEPVACARLLEDGHIGRMAVLKPYRGLGIGTQMLRTLLQMASETGLQRVLLHAQCNAQGFYRRAGFEPLGEVFEEAGIAHILMQRRAGPSGES